MKKKTLEMSKEEKDKRMRKSGRKVRRDYGKNIKPKSASIGQLSIKLGKMRDELTTHKKEIKQSQDLLEDSMANMLERMEVLMELPTIKKEILEMEKTKELEKKKSEDGKEECPTCHKRFKQLNRHKCKIEDGKLSNQKT